MTPSQEELERTADRLYEQYAQPLEATHWGTFIAISPQGDYVLGDSMGEVADRAMAQFGAGVFVFKIGPQAVGHWR